MNDHVTAYIQAATLHQEEIKALRKILLSKELGLQEEMKWGKPAYLYNGKIIVVVQSFKKYFALLFYNGHLLKEEGGILVKTGPNTVKGRQIRFADVQQVQGLEAQIKSLILQAEKI